ncbi:hypothetical protein SFOMI_2851 [Sphingobium fuliginis]|uniref:Uncharacterized protein n=1 Tax=Sphingobium fuliginis (strain ATCC 27551) TaxID=336203 RepID=A0A292ZHL6_SPHSA|nr:hypothetical protein SFOMI_2851 [Sphingobium fuliginis]
MGGEAVVKRHWANFLPGPVHPEPVEGSPFFFKKQGLRQARPERGNELS